MAEREERAAQPVGELRFITERGASALGSASQFVGHGQEIDGRTVAPRFALFHAANSICSQKVRAVLAHLAIPYTSHPVNLFAGQTYLPEYVRLRMLGCDRLGTGLVATHTGNTSALDGCDGAVVPTLIDFEQDEVLVDSKRICIALDALEPNSRRLCPRGLANGIDAELDIVDSLPNYQLLMGSRGATVADRAAFSARKVAWCDDMLAAHPKDEPLQRAYTAKRAKELAAATGLFDEPAMQTARDIIADSLAGLESRLHHRTTAWLVDDRVTMADLFWGTELLRIENLCGAAFWEGDRLPGVSRYAQALRTIPALRAAVIDWPGALY